MGSGRTRTAPRRTRGTVKVRRWGIEHRLWKTSHVRRGSRAPRCPASSTGCGTWPRHPAQRARRHRPHRLHAQPGRPLPGDAADRGRRPRALRPGRGLRRPGLLRPVLRTRRGRRPARAARARDPTGAARLRVGAGQGPARGVPAAGGADGALVVPIDDEDPLPAMLVGRASPRSSSAGPATASGTDSSTWTTTPGRDLRPSTCGPPGGGARDHRRAGHRPRRARAWTASAGRWPPAE